MDESLLRALVDLRDRTLQKSRIAFSNRSSAIERGTDSCDQATTDIIDKWHTRFAELEQECNEEIADLVDGIPIVERMTAVKGIGKILSAKVVSMVDIHVCDTISALWRYAGYAVINGEREKPTKGEKLHYNARLKTTCYLIGSSFLKCNSPYRQVYDDAREFYEANRPDWTKGRQHNAAMRKMIKMWLSHLWLEWRKQEGLPIREPYIQEQLGHTHIRTPQEFGWPE